MNYYVKSYANGGRDTNTGLSDAQAWETIAKVNSFSFNTGDCVYFKCGDTWNTRTDALLYMDWDGTDTNNRAVLGAYYMDGGSEIVGVNGNDKPVIDGGWDLLTYESTTRKYEKQILPYGVSYVTIQDFKIINSHGYGLSDAATAPSNNVIVRRIEVEDTGRAGIRLYYSGVGPIIEYCKVLRDNRQFFIGETANWDSGIRADNTDAIIRYCEIGHGWGEGIGVSASNTLNHIVEYNLVWGRQSVGIYVDSGIESIVRNNIVIGTTDTDYHAPGEMDGRTWNPAGIGFNQEGASTPTKRNQVYNNVVFGCGTGIQALNHQVTTYDSADRNYAYNNTLIDNRRNIWTHVNEKMDVEFKNNLSYLSPEAIALGCKHVLYYANVGPTGVYRPLGNFWSSAPHHAAWEHASDVVGDPKFARTSGWLSISVPNDIDIAAGISMASNSDAVDSALDLGDTYDEALMTGCDYNTVDASAVATPIVVVTGDQDSYGTGWDFGAFMYSEEIAEKYARFRCIGRKKPLFGSVGRRFQ